MSLGYFYLCNFENEDEVLKKLATADNEKKFICIEDRQGGEFAVGRILTEAEWIETAIDWANVDDYEYFGLFGDTPEETIAMIDDHWDITIVPYEKGNPAHEGLREE